MSVHTPQRKQYIKRIARGSQMSLVSSVVNSPSTSTRAISELARKIKLEMKAMNSDKHDSIFRNTYTIESIKHFEWDRIMLELQQCLPTLLQLLECLIPRPSDHKSLTGTQLIPLFVGTAYKSCFGSKIIWYILTGI